MQGMVNIVHSQKRGYLKGGDSGYQRGEHHFVKNMPHPQHFQAEQRARNRHAENARKPRAYAANHHFALVFQVHTKYPRYNGGNACAHVRTRGFFAGGAARYHRNDGQGEPFKNGDKRNRTVGIDFVNNGVGGIVFIALGYFARQQRHPVEYKRKAEVEHRDGIAKRNGSVQHF